MFPIPVIVVAGAILGAILTDNEENEQKIRDAYSDGCRAGANKCKEKIADILANSTDKLRVTGVILLYYVANIDGEISMEERIIISEQFGDWNSEANKKIFTVSEINDLQAIFNGTYSFKSLKEKYLDILDLENILVLNKLVKELINCDGVITEKEKNFLDIEWREYIVSRQNNIEHNYGSNDKCENTSDYYNKCSCSNLENETNLLLEKSEYNCAVCHKELTRFIEDDNGYRYCSEECYRETWPKCATCGQPMNEWTEDAKTGKKYCSEECYREIWPKCAVCSKPINRWIEDLSTGKIYCKDCYSQR